MRAWQPGDVAMVAWTTSRGRPRVDTCLRHLSNHWLNSEEMLIDDDEVVLASPLVVIDPEDREQVQRLYEAFNAEYVYRKGHSLADGMQAALRSLIAPPPEVYEHLVAREVNDGECVTLTSFCGKVWKASIRSEVNVLGRCPDCEEHVKAGWVA